jgi:hypothetical protein
MIRFLAVRSGALLTSGALVLLVLLAGTPSAAPAQVTATPSVSAADTVALDAPTRERLPGTWQGTLDVGGTQLRVVFNVSEASDGALTATMDSPDQGATGLPVDSVQVTADTVRFGLTAIQGAFAGVMSDTSRAIDGQWAQGGLKLPLRLQRVDRAPEVRRPQTPSEPFPYVTEDVTVRNEEEGVTLAATVTRPDTSAAVPGVVLISGSGPQDRDETIAGHKPFWVMADYFTRRGFAVLRYDDRGVGGSTGDFRRATIENFATDAQAALDALQRHPGVDSARVGFLGHSEGGLVAPLAAQRSSEAAFLVLIGTPGVPGDELLYQQAEALATAQGAQGYSLAQQRGTQQRLYNIILSDADSTEKANQLAQVMREASGIEGDQAINTEIRRLLSPWFQNFLRYDPRPALRAVDAPVLALTGTKDLQVPADTNLAAIRQALKAGDNAAYTVEAIEGLNHLLQPADTGLPSEYARIETTVAPEALARIAGWIREQTASE